jgi:hypothetical protein
VNVGAEPKKVAILGGLILIGAYSFYSNVLSGPARPVSRGTSAPSQSTTPVNPFEPPAQASPPRTSAPVPPIRRGRVSEEFRPSLKPRMGEQRVDPTTIDPTLRLDLLAKLHSVNGGGSRNLFQFGAPPPPPEPKVTEPKIIPKQMAENDPKEAKPASPPTPPPPPPIPLMYYGYSTQKGDGRKRAFFLDGEDILVATEGDTVKRRYKVVRIGVNSVVMEDVDSKKQQTLPLQEERPA